MRFGKWDEILAHPEPTKEFIYTRGIWHYAQGLASIAKGRLVSGVAARHAEPEAEAVDKRFNKAWAKADVAITVSRL